MTEQLYFDVGANIGKWTLSNIQKNSLLKIVAVEASPTTFKKLVENTSGYNQITCLDKAVSNVPESVTFYEAKYDTISTTNSDWLVDPKSRFAGTPFHQISVATISLDALISKFGSPDLIKIDVEGGEYSALLSLTQKTPQICFEWAAETNDITFQCLNYLRDLGFTNFAIQKQDDYLYRPTTFESFDAVSSKLSQMIPKVDWGMVWCQ